MKADCKADCTKVIKKCDIALEAKNKAIKEAELGIANCEQVNLNLSNDNKELKEDSKAWYRNPILVGVFGALIGGLALSLANK